MVILILVNQFESPEIARGVTGTSSRIYPQSIDTFEAQSI